MSRKVNRSAVTGRFITKAGAARHPRTSYSQTIESGKANGGAVKKSAITGRFVSNATLQRHPNTTYKQGV